MQAQRVVDCHVHVFDPQRFPYRPDTFYAPAGQELGTPARLRTVLDAHGVEHALLVGPNSGYGEDNRCLLDTLAAGDGRYRGMVVVDDSVTRAELAELKAAGVLGVGEFGLGSTQVTQRGSRERPASGAADLPDA
jgi:predicted TIM-barrel fold metal-dependent hydrolase